MRKLITAMMLFIILAAPLSARNYYQSQFYVSDQYVTTQTYFDWYGNMRYKYVWRRAEWRSYRNSNGYYQYYYVWQNYYRY